MAVVVNPGLDRSGVIGHQGRIHPEQSANPFTHYGQFRDSNQPRSMSLGCGRKPTKRENMQTPNKLIPLTQQQASAVYFHLPLRCSAGLSGVRAWPGRWLNPGALRGRGTAFAVSGIVGTVAADGDVARMAVADGLGAGARYVVRVAAAEGPTVCAVARMVERAGFGGVPLPTEEVKDRDREENQVVEAEKGGRNVLGVAFGRRKEDKETWWWNEEVQDSIQRKRLAKKKWDMDRTEENRQEYKELQCRVKREVSKAKQKAYDELYTRLDTREGKKDLYRLARQKDRDDLEKTYDRVPREELWYCMRKSGIAEKYVRVVQDMYERSRTVVRCAVGQTEEFKVEVGLHQGSALSPFLFAIVMDQLSEEVRQESPWTIMFADDIVICSESREQVEENPERWRFALERRGMKVSHSKTEYMCMNEREGSGTVRLQGEEVKKVQAFKYLGSTVQSNGKCGKEVKNRVQAGWNGWRKVSGVLCDRKISARIKGGGVQDSGDMVYHHCMVYRHAVWFRDSVTEDETGVRARGSRAEDVEVLFGSDKIGQD
ncbi:hypothetical protein QTP86_009192 [Hemibagrus guttatus]|nr:hypothetical protein QTP86_009192 [Hemibagrus guttatus]